jgi:tetratricopeptide (TPR) repeat protein
MGRFIIRLAVVAALLAATAASTSAQQAPSADEQQVDDLLSRALVAHKAGDLMGAVQNYQVALDIAPDRADIRSNLGAALVGLGRYTEGIEQYRKALAGRDDPAIRLNLALALYKGGRTEEAVPELQSVLRGDPAHKQAALLLADCLLQGNKDREVIDLLTPREREFPDDLAYGYLLGTALLRQNETEKGQVLIDRIFKNGESAEGHLLMGMAHLNRKDYQSAVPEFARAVELNPALPSLQSMYGRALLGTGEREKAMRAYKAALEQQPDSFDANLQLGTLYRLDQKFDLAMTYLRRAEAIRPDDLALRHAMAATFLSLGEADKARELLEGVVKEAPAFVDGHVLLATTYYRLKRKEDGDRERALIEKLNAENQAKQPGAKKAREVDSAAAPVDATPPTGASLPPPAPPKD